jgi:hypothetical protein
MLILDKLEQKQKNDLFFGDRVSGGMAGGFAFNYPKEIAKEGLSEYFLYTIEGTETIPDQWAKRLPSLDIEDIIIKSLYKYDEDRYSTETIRFVSFANDEKHHLGQTPLPDGSVKIFRQVNQEGNLSYVGGTEVKYIPVNEEVELNLGPSRLVIIEPRLMETRTENHTFDPKGEIDGCDEIETWQLKLTNTRDIPAEMEITRNFGTDYWDLQVNDDRQSTPHPVYKKHDKSHGRFTVILPPRSEKTLGYAVTRYVGRRQEAMTNNTGKEP